MNATDRRLPWLPSFAGSVVIHGAFAALAVSMLPQLPPTPEETQISIAPLDSSIVDPLQSDELLEATPVYRSSAAGPQLSAGVAPPLTSAQTAPLSGQQSSASAIETGVAAPFAGPDITSSPAPSDSAAPLKPAAISSLLLSAPAERLRQHTILPLDSAQLSPEASEARTASALAGQEPAPSLPSATAETVPIGDNALGPPEGALAADLVAGSGSIAPLEAPPEAEPPPEAEVAALVFPEQAATLPPPVLVELPSAMQTADPSPTSQMAGPVAGASLEGLPLPIAAADPVSAATIPPSTATPAPADGVATGRAASLPATPADTVLRSGVAELVDTTERVANDLPTASESPSVPSVSVAGPNQALSVAAPPGTPSAAEQVDAERMDAGAVAAPSVWPTPTETTAPALATTETAGTVRTVTVQFVRAGDRTAGAAALPMAQTAVAPRVGGSTFGHDQDGAGGSAGSPAAPLSRQVFAAPGPAPGSLAAEPVTPPSVSEVADLIREYSEQECFAAVVGTGSDGLVQVTGYGQARTIAAFASDFRTQMGDMVPLSTTVVSGAQCTVLEAMRNWTGYPATGPALELSARQIASGGTVMASVPGAPAEWIYLLLVDQDGAVIKLAEYVAGTEGTTRSAPPVEISGPGDAPQLMVSVVSPTALTSMAEVAAQPAGRTFQALESELERRQIRASLSVTAFVVE
jgi:hypothetical protein